MYRNLEFKLLTESLRRRVSVSEWGFTLYTVLCSLLLWKVQTWKSSVCMCCSCELNFVWMIIIYYLHKFITLCYNIFNMKTTPLLFSVTESATEGYLEVQLVCSALKLLKPPWGIRSVTNHCCMSVAASSHSCDNKDIINKSTFDTTTSTDVTTLPAAAEREADGSWRDENGRGLLEDGEGTAVQVAL